MSFNSPLNQNNSVFVSGIKFSSTFDPTYIKTILLELFSQFTIIKNIQLIPVTNNSIIQEETKETEILKQYSSIVTLHNEEDANHLIKIWADIRNFVMINGFAITVKKYNNKNMSINNDEFISYAVVAIYNIIDLLTIDETETNNKDMIDYIDQPTFETRFAKLTQFLKDKVGVKDINPQLQFLPTNSKNYKPFITVQFDNFANADSFISSFNNTVLFDNRNLEITYAYKDISDKSIGKYGDSLQRSLESEITST